MLRTPLRNAVVAALLAAAGVVRADAATVADQQCPSPAPAGVMEPQQHCAFSVPPPGDPWPGHTEVYGTPVVFRSTVPGGDQRRESLVAAVFTAPVDGGYREDDGVLRILRAADCSLLATLGGGARALVATFNIAAADLDGDGDVEVITAGASGATIAWTSVDGHWQSQPLWEAPLSPGSGWSACTGTFGRCPFGWGGFAVHDLDDDGMPEIVREGTVLAANGAPRSLPPAGYGAAGATDGSLALGHLPMLADLDDDGLIELTDGKGMWEWKAQPLPGWVAQAGYASAAAGAGHVGIADLGPAAGGGDARPELVLVRTSQVQLLTVDGSNQQLFTFPVGGNATPPVLADVDGDGWLEIAVNNQLALTLFDPDCGAAARSGGTCVAGICDALGGTCPAGVAWSRPVQDAASGRTPALAFDFEGDGASEIVFADECFTRGFDARGEVIFSRHRSSCTWSESPVVAAIDDSGRAALVVPSNTACGPIGTGLTCPTIDPLFPGPRCAQDADCGSGSCDAGLCRCSSSADCCSAGSEVSCEAAGHVCFAPPPTTPGSGKTCRAGRPGGSAGIAILGDRRWSRARPIWNQPGFAVTHVDDDGLVPASSAWQANWRLDSNGYRSTPSLGPYCPPPQVFADGFEP